jgi:hypothetical protein
MNVTRDADEVARFLRHCARDFAREQRASELA